MSTVCVSQAFFLLEELIQKSVVKRMTGLIDNDMADNGHAKE